MRVSLQALTKRLDMLLTAVMGQLFAEVCALASPGAARPAASTLGVGVGHVLPDAQEVWRGL